MNMRNDYTAEQFVPNILGTGLLCLDIIKGVKGVNYLNGGSCGNVVSALSFLGCNSSIIINKYSDLAGNILKRNLDSLQVNKLELGRQIQAPRIIQETVPTSKSKSIFDHQYLLSCPDCGRKLPTIEPLTEKNVESIALSLDNYNIYYTDRTSKGIEFLRGILNDKGAWTVYEPNSSRNINSLIKNSLASHIVKFSAEKISKNVADGIRELAVKGSTTLIIRTMGKNGLSFCYRKKDNKMSTWSHLDAQPVTDFVDSSGAGDWCTAGMLFNLATRYPKNKLWLTRDEVVAALQYGQALSAFSCSFLGALGLIYSDNGDKIKSVTNENPKLQFAGIKPVMPSVYPKEYCQTCLLPFEK